VQVADKEVAVPSFRRRASVIDADRVDEPSQDPDRTADAAKARALAEEAEAEAAEAEAIAAAVGARARALKLRRQAEAAEATDGAAEATQDADATADVETAGTTGPKPESEPDTALSDSVAVEEKNETVETPEEEPADTPRRWTTGLILKIVAASLAVAGTCAFITVSVIMVLMHRNAVHEQQQNAEYLAAGRQSVVTLMSLDFNKAKEDVQRIIDNSIGSFKDDFQNQADDFVKVAQDSKVVTEITVNSAAVQSMTKDSATVLVSATSRVTNSAGAKQQPRSWRLFVSLQRDGGQIKMSKVEFVP
jgi:Mce-associated membrane protein